MNNQIQGGADDSSVDKADQKLTTEEVDQIVIDLIEERNDLLLERRGSEWKITTPISPDLR